MTFIESRNNELIKQTAFLKERREREKSKTFFFEGVHLLEEFLRFGYTAKYVFATPEACEKYAELLNLCENVLYKVTESVYEKLTEEKSPQGILCVSNFLPNIMQSDSSFPSGSIIMESVRDNGNIGTVIRTAAALGIKSVVLSEDCADIYAPKTVRASMGAIFKQDIYILKNLCLAAENQIKNNNRVFAAVINENAKILGEFLIQKSDSFIVGNEGNGISASLQKACENSVIIKMSENTESLNASAAATIIIWEMSKANG
ncbi:MAG: RNA methyltransferase [Clostridia bacterium]